MGSGGRCEQLHGHNWKVRVHLAGKDLDANGMVIDFHELDRLIIESLAPFEHQHLNAVPPFDEINPSAENIARVICDRLQERLPSSALHIRCCDVWENDISRARYIP